MKKFALICFLFCSTLKAQNLIYSNKLPWQEKPILHNVSAQNINADASILNDARIIEFNLREKDANMLMKYYKLIKVQNDKGIEIHNKLYVPMYANSELVSIKARVISPIGKVTNFPEDKVKEIEEEGRKYKLLAFEGVEKNAEIEYEYTLKRTPTLFGIELLQYTYTPVENAMVTIVSPDYLVFDIKGFNGVNTIKDSAIGDLRYAIAQAKNLKVLSGDKYSLTKPYFARMEYKLSYNLSKNSEDRLYTWKDFAKKVYTNYTTLEQREIKCIEKIVNELNLGEIGVEKMICTVENFVKTNYNVDKDLVGDDGMDIEKIYKTKNASDDGITKLLINIFENLSIKYNIVFPSERDNYSLDEQFENWNRVDKTLLYFPQYNKFLSPTEIIFRYPFVNPMLTNTLGLFIKPLFGTINKNASAKFEFIQQEPLEKNATNIDVVVDFDTDLDSVTMKSKQSLSGYAAEDIRPIYTFLSKDKQESTTKEIMKNIGKSTNIVSFKVENGELTSYNENKPLIISGVVKSGEIVERAGNKILFKIGEIIGQQAEMYQEKTRELPIDMPYSNQQLRSIIVNIPEGYSIKNLNDLNLNVQHTKKGIKGCGFNSSYTLNGNILTVKIVEEYKDVHYELIDYEPFRSVINAAADFNKVVLVLEKIKN